MDYFSERSIALGKNVFLCCGLQCSIKPYQAKLWISLFKFSICFLIFLLVLLIAKRGVLYLQQWICLFTHFWFNAFGSLAIGFLCYLRLLWYLDELMFLLSLNFLLLSVVIFFSKSPWLTKMYHVSFFSLVFVYYTFFHPFTFNLSVP